MQLILPDSFTDVSQIPTPSDARIVIKEVPQRIVVVYKFNGSYSIDRTMKNLQKLHNMLITDDVLNDSNQVKAMIDGEKGDAGAVAETGEPASTGPAAAHTETKPTAAESAAAEGGMKERGAAAAKELRRTAEKKSSEEATGITAAADTADTIADADLTWYLAEYHPHETLPFMRRNEVWVVLDPNYSAYLQKFLGEKK